MFKKTISWLLILALLCSCSLLSVFAEPANDTEAAEQGYHFKVTKDGTFVRYGKLTEGNDTGFSDVADGSVITLIADYDNIKTMIYLNGKYTLDGANHTLNVRLRSDATANVTVRNVNFSVDLGTSYGNFYQINANNTCVFDSCTFDIKGDPSAAVFVARGDLTLKDCGAFKYTTTSAKSVFYYEPNDYVKLINTTFDLSGAPNAMVGLGLGINNTYYTNMQTALSKANAGDTLTLAADYKSDGSDGMRLFNFKENLTIDGNGHTLSVNSGAWLVRAEKNVTIRNLTVLQNGTGSAMQINGGATVTLENAILKGTNATSTVAVLRGVLVLNAGSKILGGKGFYADQGTSSLIVNRGAEINVSGQLYSAQKASDSKTINGGTFIIGGKLLYRDPTADEFKNSDATLFLPDGGVATKNNSGIRFTTVVDKAWLDEMEAVGVKIVGYGTLIAPKKYVDKAGAFTAEALKDLSFVDIENNGWFNAATAAADGRYFFYGNLIKLQSASITNKLSGIGYLVVEVEGLGTFTIYGTQQNGTVSKLAAEITGKDAAQNEVLEFFRGNAD